MDLHSAHKHLHMNSSMYRRNLENLIIFSIEILAVTFAFQLSYFISYPIKSGLFFSEKDLLILFVGIMPLWITILSVLKITKIPAKHYLVMFFVYLHLTVLIFSILILFWFLFKLYLIPGFFLFGLSIFGFLFLVAIRVLNHKIHKIFVTQGYKNKNVVIIADDSSLPFIENHLAMKRLRYRIVVIFSESSLIKDRLDKITIILSEKYLGILSDIIKVDLIDEVLYLKNKVVTSELREIVKSCEELGVTLRLKHDDSKIILTSAKTTNIGDVMFLRFINVRYNSFALAVKKSIDINLSLSMIVLLCPALIIVSILIKMTSRGPILSRNEMLGLRGRQYYLYKFRTTIGIVDQISTNPEQNNEINSSESKFKINSRVTKFGRFLRKSGLEELPQLFNVLKGEKSLIGNRN